MGRTEPHSGEKPDYKVFRAGISFSHLVEGALMMDCLELDGNHQDVQRVEEHRGALGLFIEDCEQQLVAVKEPPSISCRTASVGL